MQKAMKAFCFAVAFAFALLFGNQVMAQNADTIASEQAVPGDPISEEELYGIWMIIKKPSTASESLDITKMLPDHTGMDIAYLKTGDGEIIKMQRHFTWVFNAQTQRITQQNSAMMLGDEVILPAGETSARLDVRKVDDEHRILFISDESGKSNAYAKINEQELSEMNVE